MSTTAVTLDGFPLIGATPGGGRAKVTGFDGWLTTSKRRDRQDRTGRHGSSSSRGLTKAAPFEITGQVTYPDAAACAAERRQLKALVGDGAAALIVTDAAGTLGINVTLEDAEVEPVHSRMLVFTFTLTADDPFAKGLTPTTTAVASGASVPIANAGTAAADLLVTLTTGGTVVLSAGGVTLTTGVLPAGSVIDTGAATVKDSTGGDLFHLVSLPALWPALPAGGGPVGQLGTADLSIEHYDTYA